MKINTSTNTIEYINQMFDIMEDNKNLASMFLDILHNSQNIVAQYNNKLSYFDNIKNLFEIDKDFINYYKKYNLEKSFVMQNIDEYLNNPYVKNIKLNKIIIDDKHKFEELKYLPYECFLCKNIHIDSSYLEHIKIGYFTKEYSYLTLLEDESIWMLITPHEINTMKEAVNNAKGNVVTFGLGLGYYAYMCSIKEDVKSVTIIERDCKTINLFKKYILPQFENKDKIKSLMQMLSNIVVNLLITIMDLLIYIKMNKMV